MVAVVGTATEVGKTWVGAAVLARLRADGLRVAARKPVQSFAAGDGPTDAEVLAAATGERPQEVCPPHRWYQLPMAPPMAAAALGRPPFTLGDLVAEVAWPDGVDLGWVETVGGPRSPVSDDADSAALGAALAPDLVVLVSDAGLGAINAVLLSVPTVSSPTVVVLNRFDGSDLHRRNRAWLAARGIDALTSAEEVAGRAVSRL